MEQTVEVNNLLVISPRLLCHFECPICTDMLCDHISICPMGHSVCESCTQHLQKCPTCGMIFQGGRNYALESLLNYMKVRCIFEPNGCTECVPAKQYKEHIKICVYREIRCYASLDENISCTWSGTLENMIEHFKETHADMVMAGRNFCTWDFYTSRLGVNLVDEDYFLIRACLRTGEKDNLCFAMIPARAKKMEFNNNTIAIKSPKTGSVYWKLDFNYFQIKHGRFQDGCFLDDVTEVDNISNYDVCLTESNFQSEFFTGLVKFRVAVFRPKQVEFFVAVE